LDYLFRPLRPDYQRLEDYFIADSKVLQIEITK